VSPIWLWLDPRVRAVRNYISYTIAEPLRLELPRLLDLLQHPATDQQWLGPQCHLIAVEISRKDQRVIKRFRQWHGRPPFLPDAVEPIRKSATATLASLTDLKNVSSHHIGPLSARYRLKTSRQERNPAREAQFGVHWFD